MKLATTTKELALKNRSKAVGGMSVSYHELKEEPGLLQRTLSNTPTAHHPLEGQLLMKELKNPPKVVGSTEERRKQEINVATAGDNVKCMTGSEK